MARRSKMMKGSGKHVLGMVVCLGMLAWLAYLTVEQQRLMAEHKMMMRKM
jgi:hypothetical protein